MVSSGDGSELLFAVKMAAHARPTKIENDIHAGAFGLCSGLGTSRSGRGGGEFARWRAWRPCAWVMRL